MKYAIFNGERAEPAPKSKGRCPFCDSDVIARCGPVRVWHWAHKSTKHCDHWWEPEKQWHRDWKNSFPEQWQEQGRRDEHGELHIADVLTPHGLVLEFQHSPISREEVENRITFHQNICWVVDGARLENTVKQFKVALEYATPLRSSGAPVYQLQHHNSLFLKKWSGFNAPVVIDFGMEEVWVIGRSLKSSSLMYTLKKELLIEEFKKGNRPNPIEISRPKTRRGNPFRRF